MSDVYVVAVHYWRVSPRDCTVCSPYANCSMFVVESHAWLTLHMCRVCVAVYQLTIQTQSHQFLHPSPLPNLPNLSNPFSSPSRILFLACNMQCSTPGCTRPRRMMADGSGYYDYCSIRCRDQSLPAGISQCMLTCDCCILVSNNHKVLVLLYTVTSLKRKAGRRLTDCILLIDFIYAWLIMYTPYELFSWLQTN